MASEFSITFSGTGGHNHNGAAGSGSLISTTSYSLFDWNLSTVGDQLRIEKQIRNKINLENWILELINGREISPRVLKLKPASLDGKIIVDGTLEASKIIAGTITGPLLANGTVSGAKIVAETITGPLLANGAITGVKIAANTITANNITTGTITGVKIANNAIGSDKVNNIMSIIDLQSDFITTNATMISSDYNGTTPGTGSAGWALWANGDAEFNDIYVRGNVQATSGYVGGYVISSGNVEADNTVYDGLSRYDNYRLNLRDDATITARLIYDYDSGSDTHYPGGYTTNVLINRGSAANGASIIVNSTNGGNSVITAGVIDVNSSITAPSITGRIYATTSTGTSTPIHQNGSGSALTRSTSKREYKYDIKDFTEIGLIDKLKPRIYKWKQPTDIEETEEQKLFRENNYDIGFIAEEVAEIESGRLAVFEDENKLIPSFWRYLDIIALLVAEVQDLKKRVKILENGV